MCVTVHYSTDSTRATNQPTPRPTGPFSGPFSYRISVFPFACLSDSPLRSNSPYQKPPIPRSDVPLFIFTKPLIHIHTYTSFIIIIILYPIHPTLNSPSFSFYFYPTFFLSPKGLCERKGSTLLSLIVSVSVITPLTLKTTSSRSCSFALLTLCRSFFDRPQFP